MILSVKDWFVALSPREKALIAILGLLLAATILFYGIYRPLGSALEDARTDHEIAIIRQAQIEAKVALLRGPGIKRADGAGGKIFSGPLQNFISQSAGEAGFAVGNNSAQGEGRVALTLDSATPVALFTWLAQLEMQGVGVEDLQITPNGNATIAASMTLRAAAGP